jgi:hypothetical protein
MRGVPVSETMNDNGELWQPTWTQAMTDFHAEDEEAPFENVTVRMALPASIGGDRVRIELSNQFGTEPVRIGRSVIGVGGRSVDLEFGGSGAVDIRAGRSVWSDPSALTITHGDEVVVDLFLPALTPYATANGFTFARSIAGDSTARVTSRLRERRPKKSMSHANFLPQTRAPLPNLTAPTGRFPQADRFFARSKCRVLRPER